MPLQHRCIQKLQNHAQQPKELLSQQSVIHRLVSHYLCYHNNMSPSVANDWCFHSTYLLYSYDWMQHWTSQ